MGRGRVVLLAVLLVAGACSSGGGKETAAPSTTTSTTALVQTDRGCPGIGPAASEVTYLAGGQLFSVDENGGGRNCLVRTEARPSVEWGGRGDRVLVGDAVVLASGPRRVLPNEVGTGWSRPTGLAVLEVAENGRLMKHPLDGSPVQDVTFLAQHDAAVYHPAGRNIVSSGRDGDGAYRLFIATNEGKEVRPLARAESATGIHDLAFTASGALLFVADHDDHVHIHRLELGSGTLTTLATFDPGTTVAIVASPFPGGGVAWATYGCDGRGPTFAERGGRQLALAGTPVATAVPAGWLPDGGLVLVDRDLAGCGNGDFSPGDLYVFRDGKATLLAKTVDAAAVRAVLPPPPEPPTNVPDDAPA